MDQSEIKFKYRAGNTNVSIPHDKLSKGEYYVNTSSGFMYVKTLGTDGLLFPGVIYDDADVDREDGLSSEETYKGIQSKQYLIFHKYGSNEGRFVPGEASPMCIVRSDLAEIRNGKIQVKVRPEYIEKASAELDKSGSSSSILSVMGYTDSSFKDVNQYGSSSMVTLTDIDSEGYATIGEVVSGYLLMKGQPDASDIIAYGVPGMAWHVRRDDISFEDNTTIYGNAILTQVVSGSKYSIEVYTPYRSICDKTCINIESDKLYLRSYSAHHSCHANIYSSNEMSLAEKMTIALAWRPSPYGEDATYSNGQKFYPAKPTSGCMGIYFNDKAIINTDRINAIMFGGQILIDTQEAIKYHVSILNTVPSKMATIYGGIDIRSNVVDTDIPVFIASTDSTSNIPISLIHGGIYDNCDTEIKDNGSYSALNIEYTLPISTISTALPLCHIHNIIYCDAETINGGEPIDGLETESGIRFLMIDYQQIIIDINGCGNSETAALRKYYRLNGTNAIAFDALQNITINIRDKQYGS